VDKEEAPPWPALLGSGHCSAHRRKEFAMVDTVREVMSTPATAVTADTTVTEAARMMREQDIGRCARDQQ
jgi:CBS domain-containing protein